MRHTAMRCTPVRWTPVGCTPVRYTPKRHAHQIHAREMHAHEVHTCEAHTYEVHALEMHVRKVLGSPTLQTVVRWSICRDLSCKIRVFALRDKRSLWAAADCVFCSLLRSTARL